MKRTFAIGDIHGDLAALTVVLDKLPAMTEDDTIVLLGDYVDRGPDSAGVVDFIRHVMPTHLAPEIVALRGNHEDGWLRVIDGSWPQFALPAGNGCLSCLRSYTGGPSVVDAPKMEVDEVDQLLAGSFFPADVVEWMQELPLWYEDEHALYVHAGLPMAGGVWQHPSVVTDSKLLLWKRSNSFFRDYRGKRVVIGHTQTSILPPELSTFTPEDPVDMWVNEAVVAIDTGCGKTEGFLTAVELPSMTVYESRA